MYFLLFLFIKFSIELNIHYNNKIQFLFIGCTGDLAKKYIWKSLDLLYDGFNSIICATRQDENEIKNIILSIENNIDDFKKETKDIIIPFQLSTINDYNRLKTIINPSLQLVIYFCIPPNSYYSVTKNLISIIDEYGQIPLFLYEKPLALNYESAKQLYSLIPDNYYKFSVDHYLYKPVFKIFKDFLSVNPSFFGINNIKNIEMIFYENIDVNDRLEFYNSVGVIGDVIQNHMTESIAELIGLIYSKNRFNVIDEIKNIECNCFGKYINNENKLKLPSYAKCKFSIYDIDISLYAGKMINYTESSIKINMNDISQILYLSGKKSPNLCIDKNQNKNFKELETWLSDYNNKNCFYSQTTPV